MKKYTYEQKLAILADEVIEIGTEPAFLHPDGDDRQSRIITRLKLLVTQEAARELGRRGGLSTSRVKVRTAQANGHKGGRPRLIRKTPKVKARGVE